MYVMYYLLITLYFAFFASKYDLDLIDTFDNEWYVAHIINVPYVYIWIGDL